jgi:hypothetical protein
MENMGHKSLQNANKTSKFIGVIIEAIGINGLLVFK